MTINDKTLENLSKLSKIKIDDNLRDKLIEDLNLAMNMIDKIDKINCDQIEELSHPIKDNFNLREDIVSEDINRESLQKTSNKTEDGFYLVPKVIE
jgi:aspartyl-tRNA(Asn)/glutamyl-tRNA(Gln) amidotransferase subunit C